jgi:poly-gamma-glutamate capsule biosynthesis protein CapA/YwtB (metallophosphatase superfamily)
MKIRYILGIGAFAFAAACNVLSHESAPPEPTPPPSPPYKADVKQDSIRRQIAYKPALQDSIAEVTITLTGDLMTHVPQVERAKRPDGSYDFTPSFEFVKKYLSAADLTAGNLETTCAGSKRPYSGYPAFNAPDDFVAALKDAGFDLLCTANNHSMDTEEEGLLRTIDVVKNNGLSYTGTFKTQRDRDSVRIFDLKGLKIAFLNYTYGTNGILPAADHKYMLNIIDTILIKNDISSARKSGAELVLVFFHYGQENIAEPNESQKFIVNKSIEYGADLIIGAHPHVVGPTDFFKTNHATLDTGFVAYSLGNFVSNQYWRYTDAGVILNLHLQKNFTTNKIKLSKVDYIPTWVYRYYSPAVRNNHTVMPSELSLNDSLPAFINAESKKKMKEAYDDTKSILNKYSNKAVMKSVRDSIPK